ncbi:hypothetical protein EYF80_007524 [Liparis tanakae]|uniref:Uncharacterized protein n=1 Tax=Liparis tanakae TaxID=230148 RepID=A0A4Z2IW94_9TELE|nr:hypothetical protein EYF80_007524 [Liparis tanakae]
MQQETEGQKERSDVSQKRVKGEETRVKDVEVKKERAYTQTTEIEKRDEKEERDTRTTQTCIELIPLDMMAAGHHAWEINAWLRAFAHLPHGHTKGIHSLETEPRSSTQERRRAEERRGEERRGEERRRLSL